jgi:predicted N-formylglutamate amidohydrolase
MNQIVLSCEHAGNRVPAKYRDLFAQIPSILNSHRGYDIGICRVAGRIARKLHQPLFACYTTRLLIDPNRSLGHPDLFSEFSKKLTCSDKDRLIRCFHQRYRESVRQHIRQKIQENRRVIHFSIHSFTPVLQGQKRLADIGVLYDPRRSRENTLAKALQDSLRESTGLRIRRNYPYRGNADGFITALRRTYNACNYLGFEVEINQALLMKNPSKGSQLADSICLSLCRILNPAH